MTPYSWHTSPVTKLFGLTISLGKTSSFSACTNSSAPQPTNTIDGIELKTVMSFKYVGSMISSDEQLDKEISARISKAGQALVRFCKQGLTHHNVFLTTWLKFYRAVVLKSLLYGYESWTFYCHHTKQLEKFHMQALCTILSIQWQNIITNLKVLD